MACQKKRFSIVIKITDFYIINSDNQELIQLIRCLGYIFYHQSMIKKFCWLYRFLFYDLYFQLYSIHQISQTFNIQQNIFVFVTKQSTKNQKSKCIKKHAETNKWTLIL